MGSRIYDNWERLVKATLKREEFRELARAESRSSSISSVSSNISSINIFNSPLNHSMSDNFSGPQDSQGSGTTIKRNFQIQAFAYKKVVGPEYGDKTWKSWIVPLTRFTWKAAILPTLKNSTEILDLPGSGATINKGFDLSTFKYRGLVDPEYADKTWKILDDAINQIYNRGSPVASFGELYSHAYNMVLHKFGEKLYSGVVTTMTFHLQMMCESIEAAPFALFLEELNTKWTFHNHVVSHIRNMLMYADRTFIPSTCKTPILELGLNLWRDHVIHSTKIQATLLNTLLELILSERSGKVVNRVLIRDTLKMLMDLGPLVYQDHFEKPFLEASAEFYRVESQENIEGSDFGDYLKKVDRRLVEEKERASNYLDPKTEAKITNVVEKEMIANQMLRLLCLENTGLVKMLVDDNYEDLGRMYSLFSRCPNSLFKIKDLITSHIRSIGEQLVADPEKLKDPVKFVNTLLEERCKYEKIISFAFNNEEDFHEALNSSFEYFINLNPHMP